MNIKKIICKSLGERISPSDKECDYGCYLRIFYALIMIITSGAIIANAIHQW